MEFRPCIDIHNGKVKQIVGGSLKDEGSKVCIRAGRCIFCKAVPGLWHPGRPHHPAKPCRQPMV